MQMNVCVVVVSAAEEYVLIEREDKEVAAKEIEGGQVPRIVVGMYAGKIT